MGEPGNLVLCPLAAMFVGAGAYKDGEQHPEGGPKADKGDKSYSFFHTYRQARL